MRYIRSIALPILIVLVLSGATLVRNHVYAEPLSLWLSVEKLSPRKARTHINLSTIYLKNGDMDHAIIEWKRIIAVVPFCSDAYAGRGNLLPLGFREFQGTGCSEAHNHLGNVRYLEGRYQDALQLFRTAVKTSPVNAEARYNLAMTLEILGRRNEAVVHYREFVNFATPEHAQLVPRIQRKILELRRK